jgi:hypothetical protein
MLNDDAFKAPHLRRSLHLLAKLSQGIDDQTNHIHVELSASYQVE